jgi:hypothetical protein
MILQEQAQEAGEALMGFIHIVFTELHLIRFMDWLERRLQKFLCH